MYCLEKLQRELAHFLDIDLRDLPKVQEILQSQGYTAVKKNDEIIELGQGKQGTGGEVKRVENNKSESVALSGRAYPQQQLTPFSNGETPSTSSLPSRVLDLGSIKESGLNKTKDKVLHLINKLRDILDKPIINHSSGLSGILTKSSLNKIASDKAVQKSIQNGFSKEEHFKSAEYIKELFENAILRTTHADSKGRESIEAVHRFVTPLKLNDKEANALITLLEKKQGNNKIYTIELEGLEANKEVLLKNAKANPYPHNADEVAKSESISNPSLEQGYPQQYHLSTAYSTTNNLKWQQDGNVLRSVVELDNGEKLLLSKDRLGNVYIQSNFKEQINSYDELMLQESLEKFAKDELENKLARQIETKPLAQEVDSVILSGSEKSHSKKDTSAKPQYDKGEEQGYDKGQGYDKQKIDSSVKVEPINEFGENYPQFYHKPHEAIKHLLETKSGQVQGAFYRDELGDIDLVWGNEKIGLQKIVDKHLKDFTDFKGNNPYEKMSNAINEIIENGKLLTENGVNTLYLQKDNKTFLVGLSKGWHNKGENQWIITSYEAKNLKADMLEKIGANKTISADESLNALQTFNATDKDIIPQKRNKAGIAKLDSTQIQSQIQKEAKAQQEMEEYFAQTQAKRDEIIAIKEAKLGKNADEVPLDKGQDILYKPIRDTSIVLNDESAPFEAEFAVVKLSDIKPNFDNSNTQGRLIKQESVIANIVNDFKPELIFYQEGGVNGVPIITRDGKVVSGNHRSEALKQIFNSQTHNAEIAQQKYKQGAKEFLGVELENDEIIVRRLKENMSDKQILQLAFSSNIGRESTMGEKALSTLSLYRQNIATLPKALQSENVNELKSLVAKHIDKQSNGLNTFEPNLALLTSLARNGKNSNILQSLDSIKGNAEYKNKIINMYVDNAGSFYNLAHNPSFKNLEFRDILSDAIFYTAKQNPTRELDYTHLINDIESFLNLAKDKQALKNALVLDSNKVENLTAQAFGVALAKFSRQENPSSALYECLKEAPKALELATQPTFFTQGKALSEVDIYDFLEYLINQGQVTQSQSALSSLMPRLRELRESIANPQSSVLRGKAFKENTYILREQTKEILNSLVGKNITNQNDGRIAQISRKNIAKMTSDKAIQKSVDNGFTPQEHFKAVQDIENLYQGAVFKETHKDFKGESDNVLIHRYSAKLDNANAHITLKETLSGQYEGNKIYTIELEALELKPTLPEPQGSETMSRNTIRKAIVTPTETPKDIIPQNPTKAQSEYFNPFMNEYEKIKEIKKLHTQDDNLIRVMKIEGRNDYIEPLSNMSVSKEYLQKQTAQSLKENITQAILGNQTQLKALQQGYNTYHLSPFQKEVLESALDIANNPTKLKEYKLQGLQKQLDNLNSNEAYHIEKGREYDKARYAKDREELEREIAALKGETSDIVFTDKKGKEHTLTQEVQEQWLKTFNLKSINESYIPKHSDEIREALGGKEIKLQLGSLKKLVAQGREKYIPQIKEVLDSPEVIMRDDMGEYLFIKHLKDDDYFVNVSFDNGEYLVSISNGIKETRNLNNKLEKGGSFIYQSPNFNSISQKLLQTSQYSANKIDSDIIPQTTQEIIKQAKQSGKSVAETKELIRKNKELESSIKELKIS